MRLIRLAVRNPYWVVVSTLMTALLGGVCLSLLPKDILPTFKTSAVQVVTFYPGMPAEIMEKDITTRLERWTGQSNGIARQESKSMVGVSIVKDFFQPDVDPNTAMSQVTSFAMSDLFYLPPGTIPPMVMPFDPTAAVPLALITVQNPAMDESKLYDVAYFDLRNMLQGIPGVIAPAVYGGKLRRILAYVDPAKMAARDLSSLDLVQALRESNVMIPTGDAKLGDKDVQIVTDALVPDVRRMNDFPIRAREGVEVKMSDVASVEDSHQIQTNIVRVDGKRQVYIPIYRQPGANTIAVVDGIRKGLKLILQRLPQGMKLDIAADQSIFARRAVRNLSEELILGGLLAAAMVLLFLRSARSALAIFLAIPVSVLACFIGLYATGDTLNAMTLGGLALAVGRLIDDSIVVLENITRHMQSGASAQEAALAAAGEVAMPVFAATVTTLIVFLPILFLTGIARFLFAPLARAVAFSIGASYIVAMTLVPAFCDKFLKTHVPDAGNAAWVPSVTTVPRRWLETAARFAGWSFPATPMPELCGDAAAQEALFEAAAPRRRLSYDDFVRGYQRFLRRLLPRRRWVLAGAAVLFLLSLLAYPRIGKELFPPADVGHLTIHARMPTGTRIELTEAKAAEIEAALREALAGDDLKLVISNIGVLNDWPAAYTPNSGPGDMFFEVELGDARQRSTLKIVDELRAILRRKFPDVETSLETGGMLAAALNMGLPAPINVQVEGKDLAVAHGIAQQIEDRIKGVPGAVGARLQERGDYPQIAIDLNRPKIARLGLTVEEVVKSVVTALNSSVNFAPAFWIDPKNGNHYFLGAQYREQTIKDLDSIRNIGVTGKQQERVVRLGELASFRTTVAPSEIRHLNIKRVIDVYADVSGRDAAGVAADIERRLPKASELPEGYRVHMRGEIASMREAFGNLGFGLLLAIALVYLVLAGQFRSFLDPLLILCAVPLGLIGVLAMLWATRTTFNIQSFTGVIFMVGIAVSNSILLVEFANRELENGATADDAAVRAAGVRLRPILMTSIATLLGLLPMAVGIGRGSEANVPLARAVIGGMAASTILVLLVMPLLYGSLQRLKGGSWRGAAAALLLLLLAVPRVSAQTAPRPLSYEEAQDLAVKDNPAVTTAAARVEQAKAAVVVARAPSYPRLTASAIDSGGLGGSSSALGITGLVNSPYRKDEAAGLDAAWNVYDFGRTSLRTSAARKRLQAAEADLERVKLEVRATAAEAYLRCAQRQNLDAVFDSEKEDQEGLIKELAIYVRSGLRTPVELDLVRATAMGIAAGQKENLALLTVAREDLRAALGHEELGSFSCAVDTSAAPATPSLAEPAVIERRPEVVAARRRAEAALSVWHAARRDRWPILSAVASVGALSQTSLVEKKDWSAGVGLRLPLFEGYRLTAQETATQQAEKEAEQHVALDEQAAARELRADAAWAAGLHEKRLALAEELRLVEEAYRLARRRYLEKSGSFADLRDAQGTYFRIVEQALAAVYAERLAIEQLRIAAGM